MKPNMDDLSDLFKTVAEGKKLKEQQTAESKQNLQDFLGVIAEARSQDPKHQMLKQVKQNIQEDISGLFSQLSSLPSSPAKQPIIEETSNVVGEFIYEDHKFLDPTTLTEVVVPDIKPAAEVYTKAEVDSLLKRNASFQQPDPKLADPTIVGLQTKLKFIEQAIGRIAATGPGSGAAEIYNLDLPSRQVSGDYVIDRKDYYVGVNADVKTYITLPTAGRNLKNGRVIIIKDESGHAQLTPIKIVGTIDNDPDGAEIRINNGAVQLIYRDGWRIV
jgi:hypothetical protein